ncbi:MAG: Mur ligase domain-containing protein, partial [Candidatus Paceibacterota bacterium]
GIGMSALAQLCADQGAVVSGSDREAGPVTELLEQKGVAVSIGHKAENVPTDAALLVYSDAVPEDNAERARATELGVEQLSNFALLGKVSEGKKTVAVAGTHGKTTTTGMLAKILSDHGASPTAVIGSIVKDFGSNYLHGDSDVFVVEADEWKGHVLLLAPTVLVITNLEWDHTDFYPTLAAMQDVFRKAIEKVPAEGAIITDAHHPNIAPLLAGAKAKIIDYTLETGYELRLPGEFNQQNARAAAVAAHFLVDISQDAIGKSLGAFHGTWRRFEYKGKSASGAEVYDDYAHHPTAVKATLEALRAKVGEGKIWVAFHPHLYSRTKDLLNEFATAFGAADKVFIAPIYAAREVSDGTISNAILAERIRSEGVDATALDSFDAIEQALSVASQGDSVMTMGAGDIYKVADKLVSHAA